MLIDEIRLIIKAGNGGNGRYHMYHDRMRPKGGPDGGDGGHGGNVYFRAINDISLLSRYKPNKVYEAKAGGDGGFNQMHGANGEDFYLDLPVGSVINYDNGTSVELTTVGETIMGAKGGRGGYGNFHYRSATNQQPTESTPGQITEPKNIFVQLKLIADIGLIGLPNAGKSSLLNELTNSKAKVANYPFTTLEPNLGVTVGGLVIADIPGLIAGASDGRGLGYKFLKHIERTRILVHCLSSESTDPEGDYQTIRQELANYSTSLAEKPEILIITKSDVLENNQLSQPLQSLNPALTVSIIDQTSLKMLNDLLAKKLS